MRCTSCKLNGICRSVRENSKERFRWSFHNLVGHPLSEIAWIVGLKKLSDWLHDSTIPEHDPDQGRG